MCSLNNVAICTLNSKFIHASLAPWCLLAGVRRLCDKSVIASVIEGTINEDVTVVSARITKTKPNVVSFSCYIWNIDQTLMLIQLIKAELPNCVIIVGGPEVSYNAKSILLNESNVDYVISGEGETSFATLLNWIFSDRSKDIPSGFGICYRTKSTAFVAEPCIQLNQCQSPYCEDFFNQLNGRIAYLETSRGCPFSCAFCLSGRCGHVRFFDIEQAKKDIIALANSGSKTIKLVDRTFNSNNERALLLWDYIIKNYNSSIPNGVCFHFEIAGDLLDNEAIELLKHAPVGAIQLEIGLQSFNPQTLNAIRRKTDIAKLKSNISQLVKPNNIHIHIDLISGLPHEGLESFESSFNTAFSLKPHMLQLGFLKLLHGAEMRENPNEFPCEFSQKAPYEVISTPYISESQLLTLHLVEDALERIYNSGRFKRTTEYLLNATGFSPFLLFTEFGNQAAGLTEKITLDKFTMLLYNFFCSVPSVNKTLLRDAIVADRLCTNATGLLPKELRIKDDRLKAARIILNKNQQTAQTAGIKRGLEILYGEQAVIYVDYTNANKMTGEFLLTKIPFSSIFTNENQL